MSGCWRVGRTVVESLRAGLRVRGSEGSRWRESLRHSDKILEKGLKQSHCRRGGTVKPTQTGSSQCNGQTTRSSNSGVASAAQKRAVSASKKRSK